MAWKVRPITGLVALKSTPPLSSPLAVLGTMKRSALRNLTAGAHAGGGRQRREDVVGRLRKDVGAAHGVQLVALEARLHAGVVEVALAVFLAAVVLQAAGQAQRARAALELHLVRELRPRPM